MAIEYTLTPAASSVVWVLANERVAVWVGVGGALAVLVGEGANVGRGVFVGVIGIGVAVNLTDVGVSIGLTVAVAVETTVTDT